MTARETTWGVRRRAVVSALVVTTLALVTGGALLMWILQTRLEAGLRSDTVALSQDLAYFYATTETSGPPQPRQPPSGTFIVQIVDADGTLVSSSSEQYADISLASELASTTDESQSTITVANTDFLVTSHRFQAGNDSYTVVVAAPTARVEHTIEIVSLILLGAFPLLLVAVAVGTWRLVGGSLNSVAAITTTVRGISRGTLGERVEVPGSNDEISLLASTMNDMLDRIEDADQRQRRFVSDASHDLRTPIATILAASETAHTEDTLDAWRDMAPVVTHEAGRMQHLVEGLLLLARADDGQLTLRSEPVDLDDLLSTETATLRARSTLKVVTHLEPVQVECDPRATAQIVENILQNAERFAQSTIEIGCAPEDGFATITICNDGPPVPIELRSRIFDRFVRGDESRTVDGTHSSGLGLSIVRELTTMQGGLVETDEDPRGWCRFVLMLPAQAPLSASAENSHKGGV